MGLLFALVFCGVAGVFLAGFGSLCMWRAAELLTRGSGEPAKGIVRAAILFPFACLMWAGTIFVIQGIVNETMLHRDFGIGDSARCPLPNGYAMMVADDQTIVFNPRTQDSESSIGKQQDTVFDVTTLQVVGRYILGSADQYFLLDTNTGGNTGYSNLAELQSAALQLHIPVRLESPDKVYRRYRYTWFDAGAAFLILVPPCIALGFLLQRVLKLRAAHNISQLTQ